jgi:hypothetical protein
MRFVSVKAVHAGRAALSARERPYNLACHCGAIRFEVDAELVGLHECNCSTCRRHGFLHWKVPSNAVRLITERVRLSTYAWRDLASAHHFCPTCGTPILRTGYSAEKVSINARCIEGIDIFALEIGRYDGRSEMPPGVLP